MRKLCAVILTIAFALSIGTQVVVSQTNTSTKNKVVPTVSAEMKLSFFKSKSQVLEAQSAVEQAQKNLQDKSTAYQNSIKDMIKACDTYDLQLDPSNGDPICVVKPSLVKK